MNQATYSLPKWRAIQWLADPGADVPRNIRRALVGTLFGAPQIFIGGIANSLLIAAVCAWRARSETFLILLAAEAIICSARTVVVIRASRTAAAGRPTPTDLHMALALCWAVSVGASAYAGLVSGDWALATLTCLSAAAMVGGICFRNYAAPRYVCAMIVLTLGPIAPGAFMSGQPAMYAVLIQIPTYAFAMTIAAYQLNRLLVSTMRSEQESAQLARLDPLTGLLNRSGLDLLRLAPQGDGYDLRGAVAVFYLDLDLFKAINDRHGHAAGDHVLQSVADRLRRGLRHSDHAARIGGDEFIAVVCNIDELTARQMAERLVQDIGATPYALPNGATTRLGVSVGLAFTTAEAPARTLEDLLAAADRALYEAKANGRSQYRARDLHEKSVAA